VRLLARPLDDRIRGEALRLLQLIASHTDGNRLLARHAELQASFLSLVANDPASRSSILLLFATLAETEDAALVQSLGPQKLEELVAAVLREVVRGEAGVAERLVQFLARIASVPLAHSALLTQPLLPLLAQLLAIPSSPQLSGLLVEHVLECLTALARSAVGLERILTEGILASLLALLRLLHPLPVDLETLREIHQPIGVLGATKWTDAEKAHLLDLLLASLAALSFSGVIRDEMRADALVPHIVCDVLLTQPAQDAVLLNAIVLSEHLCQDREWRLLMLEQRLLQRSLVLLAAADNQQFVAQLLAFLELLVRERGFSGLERGALKEHGLMPLTSLLANGNDYLVARTLLIVLILAHDDVLRSALVLYVDTDALGALCSSSNAVLRQLAASLRLALGV